MALYAPPPRPSAEKVIIAALPREIKQLRLTGLRLDVDGEETTVDVGSFAIEAGGYTTICIANKIYVRIGTTEESGWGRHGPIPPRAERRRAQRVNRLITLE